MSQISEMGRCKCSVSPTLEDDEEVWNAAIPNMNLSELMCWLRTSLDVYDFHSPFARTWDIVNTLSARLENRDAIRQSNIHPAYSLLLLERLENPDLVKQQLKPQSRISPQVERIKMIRSALEIQMETAFENLNSAWMDIAVVIDTTKLVGPRRHNTILEAALISLSLIKCGNEVDVVTFDGSNEVNLVSEETNNVYSMAKAIKRYHTTTAIDNINKYLMEKVCTKQLIVVIGSRINHKFFMENLYRHNPLQPRFVFCNLNSGIESFDPIECYTLTDNERVIVTSGFDDKLVAIITGFGML